MDGDGGVIAIGRSEYEFQTPRPLWSEQSPHVWWGATIDAIRHLSTQPGVDLGSVGAVGLTGQMHGLVLLDQTRQVLRPAILWNDQRTQAQCDEIRSRVGRERLIQITGNDASAGFTAPKILWVRDDEPEVYRQVSHVLLPKDYVRLMLTDRLPTRLTHRGRFCSISPSAIGRLSSLKLWILTHAGSPKPLKARKWPDI